VTGEWIPFSYREYWDYPRWIVLERNLEWYLIVSAFDDAADEYAPDYRIIPLGHDRPPAGSWAGWGLDKPDRGKIQVGPNLFDATRRKMIRWDLIEAAMLPREAAGAMPQVGLAEIRATGQVALDLDAPQQAGQQGRCDTPEERPAADGIG
jgi:hypothetical protein